MTAPLRVRSHIVGASLLINHAECAQVLRRFYQKVFVTKSKSAVNTESWIQSVDTAALEPLSEPLSAISQPPTSVLARLFGKGTKSIKLHGALKAVWVPHLACSRQQAENAFADKSVELVSSIPGKTSSDPGSFLVMTSKDQCGEVFPFILKEVGDAEDDEPFSSPASAPFKTQPRLDGVVNWLDLCVATKGNERRVARLMNRTFGWTTAVPLTLPNGHGEYITCLNDTGELENRNKVSGILPLQVLLGNTEVDVPRDRSTPLVTFCCKNQDSMHRRIKLAEKEGATVAFSPMAADGMISAIRDPCGAVFGLYWRNDDWNAKKPLTIATTEITKVEAIPMPIPDRRPDDDF